MNETSYCGKVAILGRPNVGKSSLLNELMQDHIAITTEKPQTTETQILGILTEEPHQCIFIDTPGLHQHIHRHQNRLMNRSARQALYDADLVLFVINEHLTSDDESIIKLLKKEEKKIILVINKIDLNRDMAKVFELVTQMQQNLSILEALTVSAKTQFQLPELKEAIKKHLPQGPFQFKPSETTTQTEAQRITEIIRKQLLLQLHQELPYECRITIDQDESTKKGRVLSCTVHVREKNHRKIVIGKQGNMIKQISQNARLELNQVLSESLHLKLWVRHTPLN